MENDFKKSQIEEARRRLEMLQEHYSLHRTVLEEFNDDYTIFYSEDLGTPFRGILYWLDEKEQYKNAVKEIEDKNGIYVYHCILNHTECGEMLSMLYVSKHQDEWKLERKDLLSGNVIAYVAVLGNDVDSEFGSIKIAGANGGLIRVY